MLLNRNSCAIMQPTFMPWVGYFNLINSVNKFIFLDDVQLVKRSWQVRNKIKTPNGTHFITLPIEKTKLRDELYINKAIIKNNKWNNQFLKMIRFNYGKTPYFAMIYSFLEDVLSYKSQVLSEFNINMIVRICDKIDIRSHFITSSDLKNIKGAKDKKLVDICLNVGCHSYLSPPGSSVYIESETPGGEFTKNNIELHYYSYNPVVYKQMYGSFVSHMGIFDLLFNEGFEKSKAIITYGHREPSNYNNFTQG